MKVNPINSTPFSGVLKIQSNWKSLYPKLIAPENIQRIEADNNTDNVKIIYQDPETDESEALKLSSTDPTMFLSAYTAALNAPFGTVIDISA